MPWATRQSSYSIRFIDDGHFNFQPLSLVVYCGSHFVCCVSGRACRMMSLRNRFAFDIGRTLWLWPCELSPAVVVFSAISPYNPFYFLIRPYHLPSCHTEQDPFTPQILFSYKIHLVFFNWDIKAETNYHRRENAAPYSSLWTGKINELNPGYAQLVGT